MREERSCEEILLSIFPPLTVDNGTKGGSPLLKPNYASDTRADCFTGINHRSHVVCEGCAAEVHRGRHGEYLGSVTCPMTHKWYRPTKQAETKQPLHPWAVLPPTYREQTGCQVQFPPHLALLPEEWTCDPQNPQAWAGGWSFREAPRCLLMFLYCSL